ncbi:isoleucine--tRNA ligase [Azorhizobium oxalatiphilum]|uniref:Isoleucine--tRNA ligase n=1 Tax=Azorhizobium oxalatiphilum TaxID=980631 RepID=A0A917FG53_9HYPH|nr:isoleucine--tRNA ligase [Azorhizobium oxalatiphilum]GGF78793.1 isoleucine--tRNA ligase [Azorhizobium oxalatiphilum]
MKHEAAKLYPSADPSPSFPKIEQEVLEYWKAQGTFEAQVAARPKTNPDGSSNEFVFYDGPPFANGLPHYGHIATAFVKDIVPRYHAMKGRHVERRFGWDCHGLPAELEVEKELQVFGRTAIIEYGIDKFNDACAKSVQRYTQEWKWYVDRAARWVSFDNAYRTMDTSFMESVIWAFKTLWDKGLVYEGYRVVPYSWAVQSPLSNFETRLDNSYRERADPALTVAFRLEARPGDAGPLRILAWTTTPWTLPSNLALAVGPEIDYVGLAKDGETWIMAEAAVETYKREFPDAEVVWRGKGSDLVGRTYEPMFPYFADTENAFRVLGGAFVSTEDGTGIVHMAPGFGEEDMAACRAADIPVVVPVDEAGRFTSQVPDFVGQNVIYEGTPSVIKALKERRDGTVVRHEQVLHSYPHCWRTDEPLIYKAINGWYVAVTQFKDRMSELNKGINWTPSHVRDGAFGKWLENARDWNVSRNRFWGAPIPVWQSDDPNYPRTDVYGSLAELEKDFGVPVENLHRPFIDTLTRPNPDDPTGRSTMRRVPDVLDCWFESGSMPFAQQHYPFENQDRFEENFPGDFIVEYVAQTRGWFYTLMVLSTALFDRAPFRNCVCHGVVLDEDNQKLSKRLKNYPDPVEVFDQYGADALRWYMMSSPLMVGGDLAMAKDGKDIGKATRPVILRLWNAYAFFTMYANIDGVKAKVDTASTNVLDRYILAKVREMVEAVQGRLDAFDIPGAYAQVTPVIDALNNWYIRNRRQAFWSDAAENAGDKQAAYDTLYTALTVICRTLAPLLPFVTEKIYTSLTGEPSVHLSDWPELATLPEDHDLVRRMDLARDVCSAVLALREERRLRVRLPLSKLVVAHADSAELVPFTDVIAAEVNVKQLEFITNISAIATRDVKVEPSLGRKYGAAMKAVFAAQRSGDWTLRDDGKLEIGGLVLEPDEFELRIRAPEGVAVAAFSQGLGAVMLDTEVTDALRAEGWARDVVRLIQSARKDADLEVTARIHVSAQVHGALKAALETHRETIQRDTLTANLDLSVEFAKDAEGITSDTLDGEDIRLVIAPV